MRVLFDDYFAALRSADTAAAAAVVDEALLRGVPQAHLIREVVARGQLMIGQEYDEGALTMADEHAATTAAERALAVLACSLPSTSRGRKVVLACAEGEWHSMPGRLAGEQARAAGLAVTMLGGSLPADRLYQHLLLAKPDVLALSVTLGANLVGASRSIRAAHLAGVPVIVGGSAWGADDLRARALGADLWLGDARELATAVDQVVGQGGLVESPSLAADVVLLADASSGFAVQAVKRRLIRPARPSFSTPEQVKHRLCDYRWMVRYTAAALACSDPVILEEMLDWLAASQASHDPEPHWVPAACDHLVAVLESAVPRGAVLLGDQAARLRSRPTPATSTRTTLSPHVTGPHVGGPALTQAARLCHRGSR